MYHLNFLIIYQLAYFKFILFFNILFGLIISLVLITQGLSYTNSLIKINIHV